MIQELMGSGLVLIAGLLVLRWARISREGTLPRNRLLGYRTTLTLRNHDAWIVVHRAAAPCLTVAGLGLVAGAIGSAILILLGTARVPTIILGSSVVWLLGWVLIGLVPAARAAKRFTLEHPGSQPRDAGPGPGTRAAHD
ncbi:SdpI family protein [Leucobacter tenebrionis]|uniref:SdpI family protein n=1 Tax=Leucobacter tenebrionis TaxID=2873270 RepID=UPI001CA79787|nr:SdpI family protein [Leucobacter tenebrionis]QZY52384.1 SdpI family protein [Leucobacter tenebrionis]